jgi:hypothetical protein
MSKEFKELTEQEMREIARIVKNDKKVRACRHYYLFVILTSSALLYLAFMLTVLFLFKGYRRYLVIAACLLILSGCIIAAINGIYMGLLYDRITKEYLEKK